MTRIETMVKHYNENGWCTSHVNNVDDDFFLGIGTSSDDVGIGSFTGNDLVYYNTKTHELRCGSVVKKGV